jgi:phosphate transport system permease protein
VAIRTGVLKAGEPGVPARPLVVSKARTDRRLLLDRWTSRLVIMGGLIIIASILAILFVITAEVYPLFEKSTARLLERRTIPGTGPAAIPVPKGLGVDEYREIAYAITGEALQLVSLKSGTALPLVAIPGLEDARIGAVEFLASGRYLVGTTDGRAIPVDVKFAVEFKAGVRSVTSQPSFGQPIALDPSTKRPVRRLTAATPKGGAITVAQLGPTDLVVHTVVEKKALIGGGSRQESLHPLRVQTEGEVSALQLDAWGENLFVGTSLSQILRYDFRDPVRPVYAETIDVGDTGGTRVTALGFLIGDRTLIVGDSAGGVSSWQPVSPPEGGVPRLTRINEFARHRSPIVAITASARDKGFATADAAGGVHLNNGTSGQTVLSVDAEGGPLRALTFTPKADGLVTADETGRISHWQLDNPHPEITLRTLFGKVWYEGYSAPAYVWQSTGGTDDFEAKFSLTPLIYGTLKGTFYALLFAVPLALLAALYVSEFMHPTLKGYVKPVVEIMAALPSVVLGFLAGLWLAPIVERVVPGLFVLPVVLTLSILAALLVWRALPLVIRGRMRPGGEALLLVPVVIVAVWLAFVVGGFVEARLLAGDYRGWLLSALGLTYDQRNSLVVGVAMGFAVIPIIFTIAEDSLANVPQHLRAGSLALGATRWQTAIRIVLPTASPGIFSAIMIGFGRAVGETMIVLMATGNTPVMDWNIFSGFRALSANIAVELPEAPEQGTLFRVLFLAAFLLFCLTFAVNTLAELVRLKLRRKYRYL